jgi:hypothetical protein
MDRAQLKNKGMSKNGEKYPTGRLQKLKLVCLLNFHFFKETQC